MIIRWHNPFSYIANNITYHSKCFHTHNSETWWRQDIETSFALTHCGLVTPYGVRSWTSSCPTAPIHYWPNDELLTHWGRVTHICVGKLTIIGSVNGLSPGRRQAIIWTNAGILLIRPLGTNFSEILIGIQIFSFGKMYLKMSSAKWRPFGLGLNELTMGFCGTHPIPISQKVPKTSIRKWVWKIYLYNYSYISQEPVS